MGVFRIHDGNVASPRAATSNADSDYLRISAASRLRFGTSPFDISVFLLSLPLLSVFVFVPVLFLFRGPAIWNRIWFRKFWDTDAGRGRQRTCRDRSTVRRWRQTFYRLETDRRVQIGGTRQIL